MTKIEQEYFDWIYDIFCKDLNSSRSYRLLFKQLYNTEFDIRYFHVRDENRVSDGIQLRRHFALQNGYDPEFIFSEIDGFCSMLEMMAALAIRCETNIMANTEYGDRTAEWFWIMIDSLRIGYFDAMYDRDAVDEAIDRFLHRDYAPDGDGGLFYIRGCTKDVRTVEIWCQMNWYLETIT